MAWYMAHRGSLHLINKESLKGAPWAYTGRRPVASAYKCMFCCSSLWKVALDIIISTFGGMEDVPHLMPSVEFDAILPPLYPLPHVDPR